MNKLRDLREDQDLTLAQVGKILGMSIQVLSNYEREERALTQELINKFCDFYGVTADYLLCRSNNPRPTVSDSDTALLAAYHAAPLEIRKIVDTALAPYLPEEKKESSAS